MDNQVSVKLKIHIERDSDGADHAFYSKEFSGRLLGDGSTFTVRPNEDGTNEAHGVTPHDALSNFIEFNIPLVAL